MKEAITKIIKSTPKHLLVANGVGLGLVLLGSYLYFKRNKELVKVLELSKAASAAVKEVYPVYFDISFMTRPHVLNLQPVYYVNPKFYEKDRSLLTESQNRSFWNFLMQDELPFQKMLTKRSEKVREELKLPKNQLKELENLIKNLTDQLKSCCLRSLRPTTTEARSVPLDQMSEECYLAITSLAEKSILVRLLNLIRDSYQMDQTTGLHNKAFRMEFFRVVNHFSIVYIEVLKTMKIWGKLSEKELHPLHFLVEFYARRSLNQSGTRSAFLNRRLAQRRVFAKIEGKLYEMVCRRPMLGSVSDLDEVRQMIHHYDGLVRQELDEVDLEVSGVRRFGFEEDGLKEVDPGL